jgi:hypothetical protein
MDWLWGQASEERRERKFPLAPFSTAEALALLRLHPACFRRAFPERTVNSLYLDGFGRACALEALEGVSRRRKLRIRWYGELFGPVERPRLELKLKRGYLGSKLVRPLAPFVVGPAFATAQAQALFDRADLGPALRLAVKGSRLSAVVSFRRAYFVSADGRFRATLDHELRAAPLDGRFGVFPPPLAGPSPLIELKYDAAHEEDAAALCAWFPSRATANSKYLVALGFSRGSR